MSDRLSAMNTYLPLSVAFIAADGYFLPRYRYLYSCVRDLPIADGTF